jgi:hypothetical protein
MVYYSLVIGKNFLSEKHIEHNKEVVGYNAEEAESQYWVDESIEPIIVEEMFFDSHDGDFTVTLANKKDDSLFIAITVPLEEWIMKLGNTDLTNVLDRFVKKYNKAVDTIDAARTTFENIKETD